MINVLLLICAGCAPSGQWVEGEVVTVPSLTTTTMLRAKLDGIGLCTLRPSNSSSINFFDQRNKSKEVANWRELKAGTRVRVRIDEHLAESYPPQATAFEIEAVD